MPTLVAPDQIIDRWHEVGISDDLLTQALGVDRRTFERWRSGERYPQHEARRKLAALAALHTHLLDTFEAVEAAREWLHTDSRYLGGMKPADAIRADRIDRVEAALEA
ncbi:MAG: antitoxin Xre/MbcA/ParS toxin-binding domain-containing protein, partial [Dehalococcoidia bacterium]